MFKKIISILLCGMMALPLASQITISAKDESNTPIIGEWMWASTIADMGPDGAKIIMSRCAEIGITDVYLLVKGTGGKLGYLNTKYKNQLSRKNRDVLQEAIDAAHSHGIRIHAWICNVEDAAYKADHPSAGMWHYIRQRDNDRINLYDPGYLKYMSNIAAELAAYDIDGLLLDYIRYNHLANGWSEADFSALEAKGANIERVKELIETTFGYHGRTANSNYIFDAYKNGDSDALLIAEYRRENVRFYAKTIIDAAKKVNPNLIISAATMPEGAYEEAFANLHYGQSYDDASELYDYICPMSYSTNYGKNEKWVATLAKNSVAKGNNVVMGLQAYDTATSSRLMTEIESLKSLAADNEYKGSVLGAVFFRTGTLDYAKLTSDIENKVIAIKVLNVGTTSACRQIDIDIKTDIKITEVELGRGFSTNTRAAVTSNGNSVIIKSNDLFSGNKYGYVYLKYEGALPLDVLPAIVSFTRSASICTYTAAFNKEDRSADLGTPPPDWIGSAPPDANPPDVTDEPATDLPVTDTPLTDTPNDTAGNIPNDTTDNSSEKKISFSPAFLIPILAAVLCSSAALVAALLKRKKKRAEHS